MGSKATKAELLDRVSAVHRLLCAGVPRAKILQYGSKNWGNISDRQVDDYIRMARAWIAEAHQQAREDALALAIAQRNELLQLALQKGKLFTALQIIDSRDKLLGLFDRDPQTTTQVTGIEFVLIGPDDVQLSSMEYQ